MKPLHLILSTLTLGAMIGIAGTHFRQVQATVAVSVSKLTVAVSSPKGLLPISARSANAVATGNERASRARPVKTELPKRLAGRPADQSDSEVLEMLRSIRSEQKKFRSQLGETNRDLSELTLRVDSHSTEFRPMQTQVGPPRARVVPDDSLVLPPEGAGFLLPAKP